MHRVLRTEYLSLSTAHSKLVHPCRHVQVAKTLSKTDSATKRLASALSSRADHVPTLPGDPRQTPLLTDETLTELKYFLSRIAAMKESNDESSRNVAKERVLLDTAIIVDVLRCLNRDSLCAVEFATRRLRDVVDLHLRAVCLRVIRAVEISGNKNYPDRIACKISANGHELESEDYTIVALVRFLGSSFVTDCFQFNGVTVTHELCRKLKENGSDRINIHRLTITKVSASPETLRELATNCFGDVASLWFPDNEERLLIRLASRIYHPSHFDDTFLAACTARGIADVELTYRKPKFSSHYAVTADGILAYCFGGKDEPRELRIGHIQLPPSFFKRLVEVNLSSTRVHRLRLRLRRLRLLDLDTSGYDEERQELEDCQLWEFRKDDVRFQIWLQRYPLDPGATTLELRRCVEPADGSRFFY